MTLTPTSNSQTETTHQQNSPRPKIFIVFYSTYLHIYKLALAIKKGIEKEGLCDVALYQIAETLSLEVQTKIRAPPKPDVPIVTPQILKEADGILFGFPTRYGTLPSQLKEFFDACGQLWATGGLAGKFAGAFVSTATQHGGQESSIFTLLTTIAHFGMMFVPLGYVTPLLNEDKVIMGGGPWGASMSAGKDGTRQPSEEELEIVRIQGVNFSKIVAQFHRAAKPSITSAKALGVEIINDEEDLKEPEENNITPYASAVSLLATAKVDDSGNNDITSPREGATSPDKFFPAETTSFSDRVVKDVPSGNIVENPVEIVEKPSESTESVNNKVETSIESDKKPMEMPSPLSASKALADFSIVKSDSATDRSAEDSNLPSASADVTLPPISNPSTLQTDNSVLPPAQTKDPTTSMQHDTVSKEVSPDITFKEETQDLVSKDPESLIEMSVIDEIFNDVNNEFSTEMEKTVTTDSKDKAVNGMDETDTNEKPPIYTSGPKTEPLVEKAAMNIENEPVNVENNLNSTEDKDGDKLNTVNESYFPPQENSLQVNSDTPVAAPGSEPAKSPDIESRGLMASKAFNKDNPESEIVEPKPTPNPLPGADEPKTTPITEELPTTQSHEPVSTVPQKKSSIMELPLPVTATEAAAYKKKPGKSSTNNLLASESGSSGPNPSTESSAQDTPQRRASTFARNSATNLRRFFKTLSIRGKPSDLS